MPSGMSAALRICENLEYHIFCAVQYRIDSVPFNSWLLWLIFTSFNPEGREGIYILMLLLAGIRHRKLPVCELSPLLCVGRIAIVSTHCPALRRRFGRERATCFSPQRQTSSRLTLLFVDGGLRLLIKSYVPPLWCILDGTARLDLQGEIQAQDAHVRGGEYFVLGTQWTAKMALSFVSPVRCFAAGRRVLIMPSKARKAWVNRGC